MNHPSSAMSSLSFKYRDSSRHSMGTPSLIGKAILAAREMSSSFSGRKVRRVLVSGHTNISKTRGSTALIFTPIVPYCNVMPVSARIISISVRAMSVSARATSVLASKSICFSGTP